MTEEQAKKLKELLQISSESLTKKDFEANFKIVIDLIKQLKVANKEEMTDLKTRYSKIVQDINNDSERTLDQTKKDALEFCNKEIKRILSSHDLGLIKQETMDYCDTEISRMNRLVQQKLDSVKNGRDGKDADEVAVVSRASKMAQEAIKPLVSTERIAKEISYMGEPVRNALERLPDGQKLDIEAVEELPEKLKELKELVKKNGNNYYGGGASSGSGTTTPGGSDTQVQFNDGGTMAGDSGLTFNKTTNALIVGGDITAANLSGTNTGDQTSVSGNAGTVTVADAGGDTTTWPLLGTDQTGSLSPRTDAGLTYNANTNALTTTTFVGALTGNADTATSAATLTTPRTIGGVSFDGSANITVSTATGGFTVSGGNLAVGTNSITITGSIGSTGSRVTKGWFTQVESTNIPTVGGTNLLSSITDPSFTSINLGAGGAVDTTISRSAAGIIAVEGVDIVNTSASQTLTNKTLTSPVIETIASNTLTLGTGTFTTLTFDAGASDPVITAASGSLTVTTGDLRVTSANVGTNANSVPTLSSTSTLTNKTLTSPTLTTPSAFTTGGDITLLAGTSVVLTASFVADGLYSGITRAGTAGATLAFGDLVYLAAADSRWELADADAASTSGDVLLGMCVQAAASDGSVTKILLYGNIRADAAFPALTIGAPAYVGTTAGDIQTTQPSGTDDVIRRIGFALTADELLFNPSNDYTTHI